MILRPVTPASPCGPPTTKRPVGLIRTRVFLSIISAGITRLTIFSVMSSRSVSFVTSELCCVETTTVSTRTGLVAVVFDGDLRLAVGPEVVEDAVAPRARQPLHELVREHDRQRHQLVGLGAGVAEHQPLVAGAARVDALRDVGRLLVDRRQHGAGLGVEAELRARVADVLDRLADDLRKVDVAGRGDLAGDDGEAGRDQRFAGDAADRDPARGWRRESESEIWSAILSGCPSVTDSDVNRWRPLRLMRVELLRAARARTGRGRRRV